MPPETAPLDEIATNVLTTTIRELGLESSEFPATVRDLAADYRETIHDILSTSRLLETDLADLKSKRDLLPAAGYDRLVGDATRAAQERANAADSRAARLLDQLDMALTDCALPDLRADREPLARQELALLLGNARGPELLARVKTLPANGSREALAVLVRTPFGESFLSSRGVKGRDFDDVMRVARTVGAASAIEHGETVREVLAAKARPHVGKLGASKGAAGVHLYNVVKKGQR